MERVDDQFNELRFRYLFKNDRNLCVDIKMDDKQKVIAVSISARNKGVETSYHKPAEGNKAGLVH